MLFNPVHRTRTCLALQGGGAHGAFTWGVLDRLLEVGRLDIEAISGTSAGAVNAVALADGMAAGGPEAAREALDQMWRGVADSAPAEFFSGTEPQDAGVNPAVKWMLAWTQVLSPYELNPLKNDPLLDLLHQRIDFERLRRASGIKLYLAATEVSTGGLRLFETHELTAEMVRASTCLPTLHHAVEIDGKAYWDGGYVANPALHPLIYDCSARDLLIVLLSPLARAELPRSAQTIRERILEVSFGANLVREMRDLAHARAYARGGLFRLGRLERRLNALRFHMLEESAFMAQLGPDSKLVAHLPFLLALRDRGRACASAWLARHGGALGKYSSVELEQLFG
ncbi:MAG: patatin-like phospholipase family protein [Rhodocyclaceae bacterium]|nr:patatin-like phospholipase family protein [Rhodocyclaceae bacterium]